MSSKNWRINAEVEMTMYIPLSGLVSTEARDLRCRATSRMAVRACARTLTALTWRHPSADELMVLNSPVRLVLEVLGVVRIRLDRASGGEMVLFRASMSAWLAVLVYVLSRARLAAQGNTVEVTEYRFSKHGGLHAHAWD